MDYEKPLSGCIVIEFSRHVAGAAAANMLGYLGASVIKVETRHGDPYRLTGRTYGIIAAEGENPLFDTLNDYKRNICLNLREPEGKDILLELIRHADFFVTNYRLQVLQEMGLSYEDLSGMNPRLIYGLALGYGPAGPDAAKAAFDATGFYARSGFAFAATKGDALPGGAPAASGDTITASGLTNGLLAAYIRRLKNGKGAKVETSLLANGMYVSQAAAIINQFVPPKPPGSAAAIVDEDHPGWIAVNHLYRCKDGRWVRFCIMEINRHWEPLCRALGLEEYIHDEHFDTMKGQSLNRVACCALIKPLILEKTWEEWQPIFRAYDLPVEIVARAGDTVRDEQALANRYSVKQPYAGREDVYMPMMPFKISGMEDTDRRHSRAIGQDSFDVLKDFGYSEEDCLLLCEENIVYQTQTES